MPRPDAFPRQLVRGLELLFWSLPFALLVRAGNTGAAGKLGHHAVASSMSLMWLGAHCQHFQPEGVWQVP